MLGLRWLVVALYRMFDQINKCGVDDGRNTQQNEQKRKLPGRIAKGPINAKRLKTRLRNQRVPKSEMQIRPLCEPKEYIPQHCFQRLQFGQLDDAKDAK